MCAGRQHNRRQLAVVTALLRGLALRTLQVGQLAYRGLDETEFLESKGIWLIGASVRPAPAVQAPTSHQTWPAARLESSRGDLGGALRARHTHLNGR